MADIKINDLTAYTNPVSTDVLPIVDIGNDLTKKVTIADLLENAGSGSATAPSFSFDGDSDTGMYKSGTNALAFTTAGNGRLFINSSGNVGIGTTSPTTPLHVHDSSTATTIRITNSTSGTSTSDGLIIQESGNDAYIWNKENSFISFGTNNAEKMRIDSSGTAYFNTTQNVSNYSTNQGVWISGESVSGQDIVSDTLVVSQEGTDNLNALFNKTGTGSSTFISFRIQASTKGTITTNGTNVAYNTSSDYRLKENVVSLTGAADRLNQLQVHRFNFISDPDTTVDGFIAHEAQSVVPECATGTKDEVDDEGNPVYQGIDQSKLVPLLTAALQEAMERIETLEAKVAALEG